MKTILFVHHVSEIGGASYCLLNILKELDRIKYEPLVLLRQYGPLVDELKKMGIRVYFCPSLWFYPYNKSLFNIRNLTTVLGVYRSISKVENIIGKIKPDIVYFNNMFLFPYLRITNKLNIKSVIHIREHWPTVQHQKQLRYIKKEILEKADKIVAINEYSARMISLDSDKLAIVYDWIDLSKRYDYYPLDKIFFEDMSNIKVFVYTGGMSRIKGAYEVLKAFSESSNESYRLLVLGFTKEYSGHGIIGFLKKVLLTIGFPTYEYRVKCVAQNDKRIVCVPSIYNIKHIFEQAYCFLSYFTIPHANLALSEAITECVPCIAARTEESQEYTNNGELAMLFDMNKYSEFKECIDKIPSFYSQMKQTLIKGKSFVTKKFDTDTNVRLLHEVLSSL